MRVLPCAFLCASLGALLCACTDPRARPVPPIVDLQFPSALEVTSPDTLDGSLYAYDVDGLGNLRIQLSTANSAIAIDSFVALNPDLEQIRALSFSIPSGLTVGTELTLVITVSDLAGFQTTDSLFFTTQPGP